MYGGLGSKSALAYTDHFWIETYTIENSVNIYRKWVQYIDKSQIGCLTLLEETIITTTDFLKGTKVSVPFEEKDLNKILESLSFYLKYTKSKFSILNKELSLKLNLKQEIYKYFGRNWALNTLKETCSLNQIKNKTYLIIIYDIPYSLDLEILKNSYEKVKTNVLYYINKNRPPYLENENNQDIFFKFIEILSVVSFKLEVPIGVLDISASRETLQYTPKTCEKLYEYLYDFFLDFYQHLRIELTQNISYTQACISYKDYLGYIRRTLLNSLLWEPFQLKFDFNYPIFKKDSLESEEVKLYKLDKSYSFITASYKHLLRKLKSLSIATGYQDYILCIQDTSYKQCAKYVHHYLINNTNLDEFKVILLYVPQNELESIEPWIVESFETIYISDIIADYNLQYPKKKIEKIKDNTSFKALQLYSTVQRFRAIGLNSYTLECEVPKEPSSIKYYLDEKELTSEKTAEYLRFLPDNADDKEISCLISRLNNYLRYKNVPLEDVFYVPKVTKNYKHKNWVNLTSLLNEDYKLFKHQINNLGVNLFITTYLKTHFILSTLVKPEQFTNKYSTFLSINKLYKDSLAFLHNNYGLKSFTLLTKPSFEQFEQKVSKLYLKDYESYLIPSEINKTCLELYNSWENYVNKLPLLRCYPIMVTHAQDKILKEDFLPYINLMEKKLNLTEQIKEKLCIDQNTKSQFRLLEERLFSK